MIGESSVLEARAAGTRIKGAETHLIMYHQKEETLNFFSQGFPKVAKDLKRFICLFLIENN